MINVAITNSDIEIISKHGFAEIIQIENRGRADRHRAGVENLIGREQTGDAVGDLQRTVNRS